MPITDRLLGPRDNAGVMDCSGRQYYLMRGGSGGSHGRDEHENTLRLVERGKMILKIFEVGVVIYVPDHAGIQSSTIPIFRANPTVQLQQP